MNTQVDNKNVSQQSSPIFNHRVKLLIALVLLVGAFSYLGLVAFESATVYYVTVSELNRQGATDNGKMIRVNGKLVPDSYHREPTGIQARFALTDGQESVKAVYNGVLPDLFFNEHSEVILEGSYNTNGFFEAQTVIVKCPSKYVALNKKESGS